jgi:hypothetical protein
MTEWQLRLLLPLQNLHWPCVTPLGLVDSWTLRICGGVCERNARPALHDRCRSEPIECSVWKLQQWNVLAARSECDNKEQSTATNTAVSRRDMESKLRMDSKKWQNKPDTQGNKSNIQSSCAWKFSGHIQQRTILPVISEVVQGACRSKLGHTTAFQEVVERVL